MSGSNLVDHLEQFVGETVTIFAACGGESGSGFTGVLLSVNNCYVRLVSQIGTAPGCALGNCCTGPREEANNNCGGRQPGRFSCGCNNLGCVVDIPVSKIVSFVHNAV